MALRGNSRVLGGSCDRGVAEFETRYDRYATFIYGIGLWALRDRAAAADLTERVFLEVWNHPQALSEFDFAVRLTDLAAASALASLATKHISEDQKTFDASPMLRCLTTLPKDERYCLMRCIVERGDIGEFARVVDIPLSETKARVRRALRVVARALTSDGRARAHSRGI